MPLNAAPSSSTTVVRLFLFTELTVVSRSVSSLVVSIGVPGHRGRDLRPVREVGLLLGLRLQVDVLLADRGPVGHDRLGAARDVLVLLLDVQHDVDALVGQHHVADLADGDAAVGHLGPGEDAAGLGEVRRDGVGLVEDQPVEAGVAGAHEGHADHRDQREDDELDLGPAGDHRCTIPHTSRAPRSESAPVVLAPAAGRRRAADPRRTRGRLSSPPTFGRLGSAPARPAPSAAAAASTAAGAAGTRDCPW